MPKTGDNNKQPTVACLLCPDDDDEDGFSTSPYRHLEIVGLHCSNNGRSCNFHDCCGRHVRVGDLLRIKMTVVDTTDGVTKEALCCVLIDNRAEACRVAFIPRFLHESELVTKNINKFLQVVELFAESQNTAKWQKSYLCGGVAGAIFIDEIPIQE